MHVRTDGAAVRSEDTREMGKTQTSAPSLTPGVFGMDGSPGRPNTHVMSGMISSATMFATLIIGLIAGPAVSL